MDRKRAQLQKNKKIGGKKPRRARATQAKFPPTNWKLPGFGSYLPGGEIIGGLIAIALMSEGGSGGNGGGNGVGVQLYYGLNSIVYGGTSMLGLNAITPLGNSIEAMWWDSGGSWVYLIQGGAQANPFLILNNGTTVKCQMKRDVYWTW